MSGSVTSYARAILVPLLLLLLACTTIPVEVYSQNDLFSVVGVVWGTPNAPVCVGPGMSAQRLTVIVKYTGNETIGGVKAELDLPWYFVDSANKLRVAEAVSYGAVSSGQTVELGFWLDVSPSTPAGEYTAYMDLYVYKDGYWRYVESHGITLTVRQVANIVLSPTLVQVYPGFSSISVHLENRGGGYAYNVVVSIQAQQVSVIEPGAEVEVGDLPPATSKEINLKVYTPSSLAGGLTPLSVKVSYLDSCGLRKEYSATVYLLVNQPRPPQLLVKVTPTALWPGRDNEVTLVIENAVNTTVSNVTLVISTNDIVLRNSTGKILLGDLGPGESKNTTLLVAVPQGLSGTAQLVVTAIYVDAASTTRSEVHSLTLPVVSVERPVSVALTPTILEYGDNSVVVEVANSGLDAVYDVTVYFTAQQLVFKDFSGKWYVGTLKPGEKRYLNLTVFAPSSSPLVTQIVVTAEYRDQVGATRTESFSYGLTVKPSTTLITVVASKDELSVGENELSITIENSGEKPVYNLVATVSFQQALVKGFDGKWYVGDLQPKESKSITLRLLVPPTTSTVQMSVTLSYTDAGGASRTENRLLSLPVKQLTIGLEVWAEPQNVSQGENVVTVYVKNVGDVPVYNTVLSFSSTQQLVVYPEKVVVGELGPGEVKEYSLRLLVVATGSALMQLPVGIMYTDPGGTTRSENSVVAFRLTTAPTTINLKVVVEPQVLSSGRLNSVNLTVLNTASVKLENVSLTVSLVGASLVGSDARWYIGTLDPGEPWTVKLDVYVPPAQQTQSVTISATFTYVNSATGSTVSEVVPLTVMATPTIGKRPLEVVTFSQVLVAGQVNNLSVIVVNSNDFEVLSALLSIAPPSGTTLLTRDTYFVERIAPGGNVTVDLALYIPPTISGSTITIPMSLSYFDGATVSTESKSLSFLLALPPDIKASSYTVLPQVVSPGQTFSVSFTLANMGLGTAYNVTVRVQPSPLYTALMGYEYFVGDLAKGATTTVTFSFRLSNVTNMMALVNETEFPQASRSVPVKGENTTTRVWTGTLSTNASQRVLPFQVPSVNFVVVYSDNVGRKYETNVTIPIAISTSTPTSTTTYTGSQVPGLGVVGLEVVVVVVFIAVMYVVIRFLRRRK